MKDIRYFNNLLNDALELYGNAKIELYRGNKEKYQELFEDYFKLKKELILLYGGKYENN